MFRSAEEKNTKATLQAAKATGLAAHIAHATYPGRGEGDAGLRGAEIHAHPGAAACGEHRAAEVIAKFKNTKY